MEENMEENKDNEIVTQPDNITQLEIEEEMKVSYLDYAMSVIVGRALPDIRDGLKPVHRRVLYTMHSTGLTFSKPYKKSANVVGNCMAKYHPHGDSSIYDTLVRLAQPFSLRYPLVDGQGNFGSIDGDSAAAMRYTEARLAKISDEVLSDIDKDTVDFVPNFDNSTKEPSVLPTKIPNLLVNGSSGIAVGMATNIPPHNLSEISEAIVGLIDNPDMELSELMEIVKGPDFPTGGLICGKSGIFNAYSTGRGKVIVRAKHVIEEISSGKKQIVINEIPYMVNKSFLLEHIVNLIKEKKIEGISDLRDESDRDGMRIIIELKSGANEEIVLNQLYKHSRLQDTFGINMLALVDNEPKTLPLKNMLSYFIQHRKVVVTRRIEYNLKVAHERAHVLEGLLIALDHIDEVIAKIKKSRDPSEAQIVLMGDYSLSEKQAKTILEMKLSKLSSLEQEKIRNEYDGILKDISEYKDILANESRIFDIIKEETLAVKERFGDERRSEFTDAHDFDLEVEDLIKEEDMIVTITHLGYIKRLPIDTYKEQRRGGRGVLAAGKKEEDFVENVFVANTHHYLLFFTNKGRLHWLKVYRLPQVSRQSRGTAIVNILNLSKDERVTAIAELGDFKGKSVMMCTRKGVIKKVDAIHFSNPRKGGIIAVNLDEGDELISAALTTGDEEMMVASSEGKAVRFKNQDVRSVGRTARGVRAISLAPGDFVVAMVIIGSGSTILTVTENGYGKRTKVEDYRLIKRGGSGVRNIITSPRNGKVVSVSDVLENDSLVFISSNGIAIRVKADTISLIGRNTQGVRLMRLREGDSVSAVAKVIGDDEEHENSGDSEENKGSEENEVRSDN